MSDIDAIIREMKAKRSGTGWMARCPCHDDKNPSLSISQSDDGKVLVKCFSGCPQTAVIDALRQRGVWPEPRADTKTHSVASVARKAGAGTASTAKFTNRDQSKKRVFPTASDAFMDYGFGPPDVAMDFHDSAGELVLVEGRWSNPDGTRRESRHVHRKGDGWEIGNVPPPRPLYRLPEIIDRDGPVCITEGPHKAKLLAEFGFNATASTNGSQAAEKSDWNRLAGREILFFADNDDAGRKFQNDVAIILASLKPQPTFRVVELPDLPPGGDVVDFVKRRRSEGADEATIRSEIRAHCDAAPIHRPLKSYGNIEIVNAADVKPEKVNWLWPGRIARGKLTIPVGHPGLGKSLLVIDIAARVTTGSPWPDLPGERAPVGGVLIVNGEDGTADTIVPRLEAAGADRRKVNIVKGISYRDEKTGEVIAGWFTLENVRALEDAIRQTPDCAVCIIDPITAFIPSDSDSHKNADVRALLRPIADLAERTGVAVLAVSHLTKNSGGATAVTRVTGSLAFAAAARSVWAVTRDPDDEHGPRRLFLPVKNNVGPDGSGLAFSLTTEGGQLSAPRLEWERGAVTLTADEALAFRPKVESPERDDAAEWLKVELSEGSRPVRELKKVASDDGHSWRTVERAKQTLRVQAVRQGYGKEGTWVWELPESKTANVRQGSA